MCSSRIHTQRPWTKENFHFCSCRIYTQRLEERKKIMFSSVAYAQFFFTADSIQMSSPWLNESHEYDEAEDPGNMKSAHF